MGERISGGTSSCRWHSRSRGRTPTRRLDKDRPIFLYFTLLLMECELRRGVCAQVMTYGKVVSERVCSMVSVELLPCSRSRYDVAAVCWVVLCVGPILFIHVSGRGLASFRTYPLVLISRRGGVVSHGVPKSQNGRVKSRLSSVENKPLK